MHCTAFTGFLLASAVLVAPIHAAVGRSEPTDQAQPQQFLSDSEIKDALQTLVTDNRVKGIALGLLEPNGRRRIIVAGDAGAGVRRLGRKTVFEIGSITKTFTGALLAEAVRRGEVKLDDPVSKYLPENVRVPSHGGRIISLLDLATQRSGLPRLPTGYVPPDAANPYADFDEAKLHDWLSAHQLARAPGEKPEYSNLGAGLLGHALARAAGMRDFQQLVRERIIAPLGMRNTGFGSARGLGRLLAQGHDEKGTPVSHWDVSILAGAGGINASITDMLQYLAANSGPPANLLERSMRAAHQPREQLSKDWRIGLFWQSRQRDGQTVVTHSGGTGGFSSAVAFDPASGAGAVLLANSGDFDSGDDLLFQLLKLRPARSAGLALAPYDGTYALSPGRALSVAARDGKLFATLSGQAELRLYPHGKDRFMPLMVQAEFEFVRDSAGQVRSLTLHQNGKTTIAQKDQSPPA